jgi:hypothetical protein
MLTVARFMTRKIVRLAILLDAVVAVTSADPPPVLVVKRDGIFIHSPLTTKTHPVLPVGHVKRSLPI